jgi:hypothetical protein
MLQLVIKGMDVYVQLNANTILSKGTVLYIAVLPFTFKIESSIMSITHTLN